MQSSSQGRYNGYPGYQGYPYVNPVVHDVPSLDAKTASQWANLPKKTAKDAPRVMSPAPSASSSSSLTTQTSITQDRVYPRYQGYPYVNPRFVDVAGTVGSGTSSSANSSQAAQSPETPSDTVPPKKDIDENPVVYIDLPEAGSQVSRSIENDDEEEPEFVRDTIMYDQFDNRRIDMPKDDTSSESGSTSTYTPQYPSNRPMPHRPNTLNIAGASGSGSQSPATSSRQTPGLPSFMSKESQVYGTDGADGFPLSPIPISEFPEPPPAYTELAETPQAREIQREPPRDVESPPPPRTQVIVNESVSQVAPPPTSTPIIGVQSYNQKNLICHHCGARVHTMVMMKIGPMTHFIACLVLFIFVPFVIAVYCMDFFKYKNHYCPNCRRLIGYETPILGQKVTYVT